MAIIDFPSGLNVEFKSEMDLRPCDVEPRDINGPIEEPAPKIAFRSPDFAISPDGTMVHKRWLNEDGSRKAGAELQAEILKAELEVMANKLLGFADAL